MGEYVELSEIKSLIFKTLKNNESFKKFKEGEEINALSLNDNGILTVVFENIEHNCIKLKTVEIRLKGKINSSKVIYENKIIEMELGKYGY